MNPVKSEIPDQFCIDLRTAINVDQSLRQIIESIHWSRRSLMETSALINISVIPVKTECKLYDEFRKQVLEFRLDLAEQIQIYCESAKETKNHTKSLLDRMNFIISTLRENVENIDNYIKVQSTTLELITDTEHLKDNLIIMLVQAYTFKSIVESCNVWNIKPTHKNQNNLELLISKKSRLSSKLVLDKMLSNESDQIYQELTKSVNDIFKISERIDNCWLINKFTETEPLFRSISRSLASITPIKA